jgi:uncharacterized protein
MLILEGLMPLLLPRRWRQLFEQLLHMHDGQIRFLGLALVVAGLFLFWWVS